MEPGLSLTGGSPEMASTRTNSVSSMALAALASMADCTLFAGSSASRVNPRHLELAGREELDFKGGGLPGRPVPLQGRLREQGATHPCLGTGRPRISAR